MHALMGPHVGEGRNGQQVKLEVEEGELEDITILAEWVRPGRPKLDLVLKDEVKKAKGAMAVAGALLLFHVFSKAKSDELRCMFISLWANNS